MPGKGFVDLGQHTRLVFVDMQQARAAFMLWQRHFREIHRRQGRAVITVFHQFTGDFKADILLRFLSRATDMRG